MLQQCGDDVDPGLRFIGGSHCVLEIEEDIVGVALQRLAEHARLRAGHRELTPLQPRPSGLVAGVAHRRGAGSGFSWCRLRRLVARAPGEELALRQRRRGAPPILLRRRDSSPGVDLHADVTHRQLGSSDAPEEHQLVEITQMPDAEEPTGHSRQTGAKREIIAPVGDIDHFRAVHSGRNHDGGDRVGVPLGARAQSSKPHAFTARRVPSARRWWRANTFSSPSSSSMAMDSRSPYSMGSEGV